MRIEPRVAAWLSSRTFHHAVADSPMVKMTGTMSERSLYPLHAISPRAKRCSIAPHIRLAPLTAPFMARSCNHLLIRTIDTIAETSLRYCNLSCVGHVPVAREVVVRCVARGVLVLVVRLASNRSLESIGGWLGPHLLPHWGLTRCTVLVYRAQRPGCRIRDCKSLRE